MKRLFTTMLLTSVAAFVGCTKEGTTGGPGATDTGTKPPLVGRQDNTFAVTTSTITVKPAAPATLGTIGIKRGTGFDQAVTIELADLPKGVTVDPATGTIPAGATEVKFNFLAAEGAVPSDYVVKVTAKPTTGANSTGDFKLTVKNPDTFSISVPFWTTGIKQGETN